VTERGPHVGIAQHARQLARPRVPGGHGHVAGRDPAARPLGHDQMVVRVGGDLREMGDHEHLPLRVRRRRDRGQRVPDPATHLAPDSLVHFVEHEGRDGVVAGQDDLQRQHQPRQLTA